MKSLQSISIALIISAAIVVVGRLPSLARPLWNTDEAFTSVTADIVLKGGTPYKDSVDHRAPLTNFVYALIFSVAGRNNTTALHVALMGVIVGILGLLALLGRQILPTRGLIFSLIYFAVASTFAFDPSDLLAFHTEWVVIVFTSLAVLFCWRALERPGRIISAMLSGVCYGLACFTKQPSGLDVLATLAFLSILAWVGPKAGTGVSRRQVAILIAGIIVGGIAVAAVVCGYFVARGAWSDFVFYVWTYNSSYYMPAVPFATKIANIYKAYDTVAATLWLGLMMVCGGLLSVTRTAGWFGDRTPTTWRQFHVTLWGVSSLLAGLVGGRPFAHYFIMILPSWCLLAGLTFDLLISALAKVIPPEMPPARKWRRIALVIALGIFLLAPRLMIQVENIRWYVTRINNWINYESKDYLLNYIRRECPKGEQIVVWGFSPELYVEADRDPATRFSYTTFIVGVMPGVEPTTQADALRWAVPGAMGKFVEDILKNRPLFIVDVSESVSPNRKNYFGFNLFPLEVCLPMPEILSRFYELVPEFSPGVTGDEGTRVYRRRGEGTRG